jgi:hypothetical protein
VNESVISLQASSGIPKNICGGSCNCVVPRHVAALRLFSPELGILFVSEILKALEESPGEPPAAGDTLCDIPFALTPRIFEE